MLSNYTPKKLIERNLNKLKKKERENKKREIQPFGNRFKNLERKDDFLAQYILLTLS